MREHNDRYKVREHVISQVLQDRYPNVQPVTWYVWDRNESRKVPFSNRSSKGAADRLAAKLNANDRRLNGGNE